MVQQLREEFPRRRRRKCLSSYASFARFRVENADCFVADDKARLLAVIESGFGTHDAFSALIRDLMRSRLPGKGSEAKV